MSTEVIPWLSLVLSLIGGGALLIWRTATVLTEHRLRLEAIERGANEIVELRKHLWTLDRRSEVRAARQSAGQFDQGRSEPPGSR